MPKSIYPSDNRSAPQGPISEELPHAGQHPQVNVVGQYIKDLSFECPDPTRFFRGVGKNPDLQIDFDVQVRDLQQDAFEVALSLEGQAKSDEGVLYNIDFVYAGAFVLKNLPQEAIQPVLFIECPALLFPFVRRLVADLSREGGFPPLLLDPIDFAGMYRRRAEMGQAPIVRQEKRVAALEEAHQEA